MSTDDIERLAAAISAAVDQKVKAEVGSKNGNKSASGNVWEKTLYMLEKFGLGTFLVMGLAVVAYQAVPPWVQANIETQHELTDNLRIQTGNLQSLGETLDDVAKQAQATEEFRKEVAVEHKRMEAGVQQVKTCVEKNGEMYKQSQTEHKAMIETLKSINEDLKKD